MSSPSMVVFGRSQIATVTPVVVGQAYGLLVTHVRPFSFGRLEDGVNSNGVCCCFVAPHLMHSKENLARQRRHLAVQEIVPDQSDHR